MLLPNSAKQAYRDAARPFKNGDTYAGGVGGCLRLVDKTSGNTIQYVSGDESIDRALVDALDGLVLPLVGKQPRQLLGLLASLQTMKVLIPACPPTPKDPQTFRPGISPEAAAGIRAARVLATTFSDAVGVEVKPTIMVADTESDIDQVMRRAGGIDAYQQVCTESAELIRAESGVEVITFTDYFEPSFHALQYDAEAQIRQRMVEDPKLRGVVQQMSTSRGDKQRSVLGRLEQDYELTVRYAAQHKVLGDHVRAGVGSTAICNYPSPNIAFYNNMNPNAPVAVFESRLEGKRQ